MINVFRMVVIDMPRYILILIPSDADGSHELAKNAICLYTQNMGPSL